MDATMLAHNKPLRTVREPRIDLVGRQTLDPRGIEHFLEQHGVTWQTDTEVGSEALAEMAGRVCYMSYGKGRKTNREFLQHIVEVGQDRANAAHAPSVGNEIACRKVACHVRGRDIDIAPPCSGQDA